MTKAEAFDTILVVAQHVEKETMYTQGERLSKLLGTIYGCMACIDPDWEEDDRK